MPSTRSSTRAKTRSSGPSLPIRSKNRSQKKKQRPFRKPSGRPPRHPSPVDGGVARVTDKRCSKLLSKTAPKLKSDDFGAAEKDHPISLKRRWSYLEIEALFMAIKECGVGKWKKMMDSVWGKVFEEYGRTNVDLKDKWRNLKKAYDVNMDDDLALKSLLNTIAANMAKEGLAGPEIEQTYKVVRSDESLQVQTDDSCKSTNENEKEMKEHATEDEGLLPNMATREKSVNSVDVSLVKEQEAILFKKAIEKIKTDDIKGARALLVNSLDIRAEAFGDLAIRVALEDCSRLLEEYKIMSKKFPQSDLRMFTQTIKEIEDTMFEAVEHLHNAALFDNEASDCDSLIEGDMMRGSLCEFEETFNIFRV